MRYICKPLYRFIQMVESYYIVQRLASFFISDNTMLEPILSREQNVQNRYKEINKH